MSRNKSNKKSGWRKKDKQYRLDQNAKAKANRERKAANAANASGETVAVEEANA
jgi:hypothetical protein